MEGVTVPGWRNKSYTECWVRLTLETRMPGRGSRTIKPDPNQPTLRPFNNKIRRQSTERPNHKGPPTETKRKRRSTGDKRATKRSKELEQKKVGMTPTIEKDQTTEPLDKMSSIVEHTNSNSTNNETIQEIRNMEVRLKGNNKSELEELETKLTNSMKKLLDTSMESALQKLNANIAQKMAQHTQTPETISQLPTPSESVQVSTPVATANSGEETMESS